MPEPTEAELEAAELEEEIAAQEAAEEEELSSPPDHDTQEGYEDDILKNA